MENFVTPYHHAEPFGASGGMHGNSAKSTLGRPNLENWELFTRETLQNSWDARDRRSHDDGVSFCVNYVDLKNHRAERFRDFFRGQTEGLPALDQIVQDSTQKISLLIVSDTGTYGLRGPTSSTTYVETATDYRSLILDMGRSNSKKTGGGTYGFGKSVYFTRSHVETILIYTRTQDEFGQPSNRFIAMAIGNEFKDERDFRFTGRHWWGIESTDPNGQNYAEPFTGREADALARAFKLDEHFTEQRPTGTSIAVVCPRINEGENPKAVVNTIAEALVRWAWPHMIADIPGMDPIDFSVRLNDSEIDLPDPKTDPYLRPFIKAFELFLAKPAPQNHAEASQEWTNLGRRKWIDLCSARPKEFLGKLVITQTPAENIQHKSIFDEQKRHHIALIRAPRMVVKYFEGPAPHGEEGYAGVFVANDDLDKFFAASEPPAHDDWAPQTVDLNDIKLLDKVTRKARSSNPVNIAMRRLREKLRVDQKRIPTEVSSETTSAVSQLSSDLGAIVNDTSGSSRSRTAISSPKVRSSSSSAGRARKGIKSVLMLDHMVRVEDKTIAIFKINITSTAKELEREPQVSLELGSLVDGSRVKESELGVPVPESLGWVSRNMTEQNWADLLNNTVEKRPTIQLRNTRWESYFAAVQPAETAIYADVKISYPEGK